MYLCESDPCTDVVLSVGMFSTWLLQERETEQSMKKGATDPGGNIMEDPSVMNPDVTGIPGLQRVLATTRTATS